MRSNQASYLSVLLAVVGCAGADAGAQNPGDSPAESNQELSALRALGITGVTSAQPRVTGISSPNILSPELIEAPVAQGSYVVENPQTIAIGAGAMVTINNYGYMGDGPLVPVGNDVQSLTHNVETQKTEPDKNTYLKLHGQHGADKGYDYGRHFLFQGHEVGVASPLSQDGGVGYITRVNLDADGAHRVTILASTDVNGNPLPVIDGSTWDPFARRLLFSAEGGPTTGGLWQATLDYPSSVEDISGSVGRGGYEGIQNDSAGNLWIVEDSGGSKPAATPHSKVANSFVYRFVPKHPSDLHTGKLQALQVISARTGMPIAFSATDAASDDTLDIHSYGVSLITHWITIHDTDVDGAVAYDANGLAKAKLATPFKRPENGQFRPGSRFREFVFSETGDTDSRTEVGSPYGGFGAVLKLTQASPSANDGKLSLVYLSDIAHSGFDNVAFWSRDQVVFVEDAGDTLHAQRNALDSGYVIDLNADYSKPENQPLRILAEGRDASATIDAGLSGLPGFNNEGDNEITGIHISNGDPGEGGLLGAQIPQPFSNGWRVFYTQQHGDNFTWEILSAARSHDD